MEFKRGANMRERIATIEVYVDTESSDASATRQTSVDSFRVTINAKGKRFTDRSLFQTTLAHELGHVVALLTRDPTHKDEYHNYSQMTGDSSLLIPAEKKAWALASDMVPLDKTEERRCLKTYEDNAWKNRIGLSQRMTDFRFADRFVHITEAIVLGFLICAFTVAEFIEAGRVSLEVLR
jgi:hypothetical protein